MVSAIPQCFNCKHFIGIPSSGAGEGVPKCKAYPIEIPEKIFENEVDHTKPFPGDKGILFEPIE